MTLWELILALVEIEFILICLIYILCDVHVTFTRSETPPITVVISVRNSEEQWAMFKIWLSLTLIFWSYFTGR